MPGASIHWLAGFPGQDPGENGGHCHGLPREGAAVRAASPEGAQSVPLVTYFLKAEQVANFLVILPCHMQAECFSKIIFPDVRMH